MDIIENDDDESENQRFDILLIIYGWKKVICQSWIDLI